MFEEEAKEYVRKIRHDVNNWGGTEPEERFYNEIKFKQAYLAGAELGYNKANEWHKPSEKLPEECSLVLAYLFEETEPTICKYVVSNQWECLPKRIVFCSNDQVRKWKEITPPKEVKENEN